MKITIKTIAAESGYSTATVSKVLNKKDSDVSKKARKKILEVVKKYNFQLNRAASSLVLNKTKTIGLLLPDISNPFFSDIAKGIEDFAYQNGYSIFFCNSYENLEKEIIYLKSMIQLNVDGILIIGVKDYTDFDDKEIYINKPIISIDRKTIYQNVIAEVKSDHYKGAKLAMEHLIDYGHKNILFIPGPKNSNSAKKRLKAYIDSMRDNKFKINKEDIIFGDFSIEHGINAINKINNIREYSAVFCCNDLIALGAMTAIKSKGLKIPDDISVIGIDDIEISKISDPSLTTMKQPSYELGYTSSKMLIEYLEKNENVKDVTLNQELILRNSSSKL